MASNLTTPTVSVSVPSQNQLAPHTRHTTIIPANANAPTSQTDVHTFKFGMDTDANANAPRF